METGWITFPTVVTIGLFSFWYIVELLNGPPIWGLLLALCFMVLYFLQGLVTISADPPCVALVLFLGNYTDMVKGPGHRFFPFRGIIYDSIAIDISRKSMDIDQTVVISDSAQIKVPISITYKPDSSSAKSLKTYVENNKEEGVEKRLKGLIQERVREWALHADVTSYMDAFGSEQKLASKLIKQIFKPFVELSDKDALKIREGTGTSILRAFGIVLVQLNIREITAKGILTEIFDIRLKEQLERAAEVEELDHVRSELKKLVNVGLNPEQAIDLIQTERGKVTKSINATKSRLEISEETLQILEDILSNFFPSSNSTD